MTNRRPRNVGLDDVDRDAWYDWVLVWRYWHGQADGLRSPYHREQEALLRLGEVHRLSHLALAARLGVSARTIIRWCRAREDRARRCHVSA